MRSPTMVVFTGVVFLASAAAGAPAIFLDESRKPDDSRLGAVISRDGYRLALPKSAKEHEPGHWRATLPEGAGLILTARLSSAEEAAPPEYQRFVIEKSIFHDDDKRRSLGNYASLASDRSGSVWVHDWQSSTSDARGTITSLRRTVAGFRKGTLSSWHFECGWAGDQPAVRSVCAASLASVRITLAASAFDVLPAEDPDVEVVVVDDPSIPDLCPTIDKLVKASAKRNGFSSSRKLIALLPDQKSPWQIKDAGAGKVVSADVTEPQDSLVARRALALLAAQLESCVPSGWKSEKDGGVTTLGEPIIGIGSAVRLRTVADPDKKEHVEVQVLEKAVLSFAE